jgi:ATP-dependent helicase/nuclease subunit A
MTDIIATLPEIIDAPERERALDARQSFIVQAPAGSGKTELLTQRFLVLLGRVNVPEEVLAITFTKKAAAEMRARLIQTLKKAATAPEPHTPHEQKTWRLAQAALQQDKQLNWNLLDNPNRLRVQTIDSFNASLIKHLPVLSHFGAPPDITDAPADLYREAVQEFLTHLEENLEWSDAIAQLLVHMDNDLNKLEELLVNMLSKRDQWLPYMLTDSENPVLREQLEASLARVIIETLTALQKSFPKELAIELLAIARFAADNLRQQETSASFIAHCLDRVELPANNVQDKKIWLGIAELLLTKDKDWRKECNIRIGFPAPSSTKNAADKKLYQDYKIRHDELIKRLQSEPELLGAFIRLRGTPVEIYEENQWQTLRALYQVLRVVVAQLKVVFRRYGKIDYIENSQAALYALGTEDNPTDLALALDYQIKHILIDEFQDTSNSQYRLIEKLTAGWQSNDSRTLFVVGDPMQSIYRFREAEVGLFIRARNDGIGQVKLIPLTLAVNFRSTATVVNWINKQFHKILPPVEDLATGAVAYSASVAFHNDSQLASQVKTHAVTSYTADAQAGLIVQLIQQRKQEKPHETIAILVRARSHLQYIVPALKKAGLNYRAIKIDPLSSRAVIQDLMALTRALAQPADRVAWLAVLRAPWCGLSLADLAALTESSPRKTVPECLSTTLTLTTEGQNRLLRTAPVLLGKLSERQRHSLSDWVESTWLALGGPACLTQDSDLDDVNAYLRLLDKIDDGGNFEKLANLADEVKQLFAATNNAADNTLQIMTIHNAKGLEFDTVILPHLEKQAPNEKKQLLLWMEKQWLDAPSSLLLAPVHAIGADSDPVYNYIKDQHATKSDHELGRLLYVAATRARQHLHLFFTYAQEKYQDAESPETRSKTLLKKMLPAIGHELTLLETPETENGEDFRQPVFIQRLTQDWHSTVREIPADPILRHQTMPGFSLHQDNTKKAGTLVHKILENIARLGSSWWMTKSATQLAEFINARLAQAGILADAIPNAAAKVLAAITNTLADPRGLWILQAHAESQTEYSLTAVIDGTITPLIIDRTFVDAGTRWIIDYKTSQPEGDGLAAFIETEYAAYANKLEMYHSALAFLDKKPIKLGLYFPLIPAWKEWEKP